MSEPPTEDRLKLQATPTSALLSDLCSSSLQSIDDNRGSLVILAETPEFWVKLREFLRSEDLPVRKQALSILKVLVPSTEKTVSHLSEVILVLDALEETQDVDTIKTMLQKIEPIHELCAEGTIDLSWLHVIFDRLMSQKSEMVSRWGMLLFLDLPQKEIFFTAEGPSIVASLLKKHLLKAHMSHWSPRQELGSFPYVFQELKTYLGEWFDNADPSSSRMLFEAILELFYSPEIQPISAVMLTHLLSDWERRESDPNPGKISMASFPLPFPLSVDHINAIHSIFSSLGSSHYDAVRNYVEGRLILMVEGNMAKYPNKDSLALCMQLWNSCDNKTKRGEKVPRYQKPFKLTVTGLRKELKKLPDDPLKTRGLASILFLPINITLQRYKNFSAVLEPLKASIASCETPLDTFIAHASLLDSVFQVSEWGYKLKGVPKKVIDQVSKNIKIAMKRVAGQPTCNRDHLKMLSRLFIWLHSDSTEFLSRLMIPREVTSFVKDLLFSTTCTTEEIVLLQLAALLQMSPKPIDISLEQGSDDGEIDGTRITWIYPYLESNDSLVFESAWLTLSKLRENTFSAEFQSGSGFRLCLTALAKTKQPAVVSAVLNVMKEVMPYDEESLGKYFCCTWKIINEGFLSEMLKGSSQRRGEITTFCLVLVKALNRYPDGQFVAEWIDKLLDGLAMRYNSVFQSFVTAVQCLDIGSGMSLDLLVRLTIFEGREQVDDRDRHHLQGVLMKWGYDSEYRTTRRMELVSQLIVHFEKFGYHLHQERRRQILSVLENYLSRFKNLTTPHLKNTDPDCRKLVKIWQSVLCLVPIILKEMSPAELFDEVIQSLDKAYHPAVRCLIECVLAKAVDEELVLVSLGHIMMHGPLLLKRLHTMLIGPDCAVSTTTIISLITHQMETMRLRKSLTAQDLFKAVCAICLKVSSDNTEIRTFATASVLRLGELYELMDWQPLSTRIADVKNTLADSSDLEKSCTQISKDPFFSKFNVYRDLTLNNIFGGLPAWFDVLEGERLNEVTKCVTFSIFRDSAEGDEDVNHFPYQYRMGEKDPKFDIEHLSDHYTIQWSDMERESGGNQASNVQTGCKRGPSCELDGFERKKA